MEGTMPSFIEMWFITWEAIGFFLGLLLPLVVIGIGVLAIVFAVKGFKVWLANI